MAAVQRRVSDPSSICPGRGRNRSDVGDGVDADSIAEDSKWLPELEPERPVLKTSDTFRRPSSAGFDLDRRVSFRRADIIRQKEGLCTAVAEEGKEGLIYKRHKGNEGSAERLVNFLYAKVLSERNATTYLKEPDIDKLRQHQTTFVDFIFGSDGQSRQPDGTDLQAAHGKLLLESGVEPEAWDHFVQHYEEELEALQDAPEEHRAVALSAVKTTKQHFAAS